MTLVVHVLSICNSQLLWLLNSCYAKAQKIDEDDRSVAKMNAETQLLKAQDECTSKIIEQKIEKRVAEALHAI